jgi:hypothetical protein
LNGPGECCFKNAASSLKTPGVFRRNFAPTTIAPSKRRKSRASSRFAHHADKGIGKISHEVAAAVFAVGENINAGGFLHFERN